MALRRVVSLGGGAAAESRRRGGARSVEAQIQDGRLHPRRGERSRIIPLFPFGHGLSYTSWSLSHLKVRKRGPDSYEATIHLRNTGNRAGAQVVQLYVGDPSSAGEPPRQLKAFQKVFLKPHHSKKVRLELERSSFQIFDEANNSWKTTPGTYQIYVGTSSRDLPGRAVVTVAGK